MKKTYSAVILMVFASGSVLTSPARAAKPSAISQAQGIVDQVDDTPEIKHLRETRKDLVAAKEAFENDDKDKANHRQEILDGIVAAIKGVDDEIDELKSK